MVHRTRRRALVVAVIAACAAIALLPAVANAQHTGGEATTMWTDPLTRYVHITYRVPADAPDEVIVPCSWSPAGQDDWHPARVMPFVSETALRLVSNEEWDQWIEGRVTERRAAGLERAVVFNPYPEAQVAGRVDIDFRIQVQSPDGTELLAEQTRLQADNSDVVYIEDWSKVLQKDAVVAEADPEDRKWVWRTGLQESEGVSFGNALYGTSPSDVPLPQLTYPLNRRGHYAIFVRSVPGAGSVRLRLTGDERSDHLHSPRPSEEVLWRWCPMDRQHLVVKQNHRYTGYADAHIDYVKLVPLPVELVEGLEAQFGAEPDKLVAGYWEPYSWAFHENVQDALQHREPLLAYVEARVPIVDMQIDRFGMKAVYESRRVDQLLYSTQGDPIGDVSVPTTDNVGRMQQYTNTLETEIAYARELGLTLHANFGASNCYPGGPLQNDFSKAHPEWMRGHVLRYEVPEVRRYVLSLYREALEIGAPGISIDFGRYPQTIDVPETANQFLRELRRLADRFSRRRAEHVPILVHFPAQGDTLWENFDYATWVKEGLVDYLCPSVHNRIYHFDIEPYIEAVRGTNCKLLPDVYGQSPAVQMPGLFLWRVQQLYEAGVDGIYVYQSDAPTVYGEPRDRRCMRLTSSSEAVMQWWAEDDRTRPQRSKGIYLNNSRHGRERVRAWLEGVPLGEVEMYVDGELVIRHAHPPYILGTEYVESDGLVAAGEHTLLIRARDGDGWLEQSFTIVGAG